MMTVEVLALGTAAGEAALGAGFAKAALSAGVSVRSWSNLSILRDLIRDGPVENIVDPNPTRLVERLRERAEGPIVACTAVTCAPALRRLSLAAQDVFTLDSSWAAFVDGSRYPVAQCSPLVAMPPGVWRDGQSRMGPRWAVPAAVDERVLACGWFAAPWSGARPPGADVLLYFGRDVVAGEPTSATALGEAIAVLAGERPALTWRLLGRAPFPVPDFVHVEESWLADSEVEAAFGAARLVLCHQGQVTIGRAAANGTPVLALASGVVFRAGARLDWADREVHALAQAGVVDAVFGPVPTEGLTRRLRGLLDHPAPRRVDPSDVNGAARAVDLVVGHRAGVSAHR